MKNIPVLFFLCFAAHGLLAQMQKDIPLTRFASLGISPLSAFEIRTPTTEVALEVKPFDRIAFEAKYGFPFYEMYKVFNRDAMNGRYHEKRFALNYYLDRRADFFFGPEFFSLDHTYSRVNGNFLRGNNRIAYDSADITRRVRGLRMRGGFTHFFRSGIGISGYATLGGREFIVRYTDLTGARFVPPGFLNFNFQRDRREEARVKFDFTVGAKFSFLLFKRK